MLDTDAVASRGHWIAPCEVSLRAHGTGRSHCLRPGLHGVSHYTVWGRQPHAHCMNIKTRNPGPHLVTRTPSPSATHAEPGREHPAGSGRAAGARHGSVPQRAGAHAGRPRSGAPRGGLWQRQYEPGQGTAADRGHHQVSAAECIRGCWGKSGPKKPGAIHAVQCPRQQQQQQQ